MDTLGEGNGTPLQYSCLENPRDSRAWWAAIYGVARSQTQLKRLSSGGSSSGDADIENRFVDTVGEGESGMNGQSSINIDPLPTCETDSR